MKINKQTPENILDNKIYELEHIKQYKLLLTTIFLFLLGLLFNFSFKSTLRQMIHHNLVANQQCPMSYQNLDVSLFLPKISISNLSISGSCLQLPTGNLELPRVEVQFRGPSFYPPGIKLKLQATQENSEINVYASISFSKILLKIEETTITEKTINSLSGRPLAIQGSFDVTSLITLSNMNLEEAQFLIKSKNMLIPPQDFNGLTIPSLPIGVISAKGRYSSNNINIENVIIGTDSSPITANLYGKINVNRQVLPQSLIDIDGEIKFSESFISDFAILTLFLGGKTAENGFYKIKLSGTLANPSPSVL